MLEELPSLHTLVDLCDVSIRHCPKLKSLEGLAVLKTYAYRRYIFQGCNSLVHVPWSVTALREFEERISDYWGIRNLFYNTIQFEDCKFASTEAMMEWAVNEEMPVSIRMASFRHLYDKYCSGDSSLHEVLFDGLFPFLLNRFLPNDNECLDFHCLAQELLWTGEPFPSATVRELQESKVGGIVKKDLVQKFQAHPECKFLMLRLLGELGVCEFNKVELNSRYAVNHYEWSKDHIQYWVQRTLSGVIQKMMGKIKNDDPVWSYREDDGEDEE